MCLAIPSQVIATDGLEAVVESAGVRRRVSLLLLDEAVAVGDYVLVQHGRFAYARVETERAREALALMEEVFARGEDDVRRW